MRTPVPNGTVRADAFNRRANPPVSSTASQKGEAILPLFWRCAAGMSREGPAAGAVRGKSTASA